MKKKGNKIQLFQNRLAHNIGFFNNLLDESRKLVQEVDYSIGTVQEEIKEKQSEIAELEAVKQQGETFAQNIEKLLG